MQTDIMPWLGITMMIVASGLQTDLTRWLGITMMIVVVGLQTDITAWPVVNSIMTARTSRHGWWSDECAEIMP